jgi:hypothetical protein
MVGMDCRQDYRRNIRQGQDLIKTGCDNCPMATPDLGCGLLVEVSDRNEATPLCDPRRGA